MLLITKFLAKLLTILNSEESPKQIAAGFAFGAWIGLMPVQGLIPLTFGLLSFLINVNLGFLAIGTLIYKFLAFAIDPIANQLGYYFLTKVPSLEPFWTTLYNLPIVPYTRFNNTIVLGSFTIGFLLLVPNYFLGKWFVKYYRANFREKVQQFKLVKYFKTSAMYRYYESYRGITGE